MSGPPTLGSTDRFEISADVSYKVGCRWHCILENYYTWVYSIVCLVMNSRDQAQHDQVLARDFQKGRTGYGVSWGSAVDRYKTNMAG